MSEHGEGRSHVRVAHRLAACVIATENDVGHGGAVRLDANVEPVAVPLDVLRDRPGPDVRARAADARERLRRRRQAREDRCREDRTGDEHGLAADERAQKSTPRPPDSCATRGRLGAAGCSGAG